MFFWHIAGRTPVFLPHPPVLHRTGRIYLHRNGYIVDAVNTTAYWLELCRKVVKPGGVAAIFIDWRQLPALYDAIQWEIGRAHV